MNKLHTNSPAVGHTDTNGAACLLAHLHCLFGLAELIITLQRSKTDQEGASFTKGLPAGINDATCPKGALEAWLQLAAITSARSFGRLIAGACGQSRIE